MEDFGVTLKNGELLTTCELRDLAIIAALAEMKLIDPMKVHSFAGGLLSVIKRQSGMSQDDADAFVKQLSELKGALLRMKEHAPTVGHPSGQPSNNR